MDFMLMIGRLSRWFAISEEMALVLAMGLGPGALGLVLGVTLYLLGVGA